MINSTAIGIMMLAIGVSLMLGGIWVLTRADHLRVVPISQNAESGDPVPADTRGKSVLTPEEKGLQFEKFVASRFNKTFFKIKEWRSDKSVGEFYAESSLYPDLVIEFHNQGAEATFAVECKWRKAFDSGGKKPGIEWATERQIHNYQEYSYTREEMPVFVVIGIGGSPDNPDEVFVINLIHLRYPYATAEYLSKYRRKNRTSNFYYDYKNSELR